MKATFLLFIMGILSENGANMTTENLMVQRLRKMKASQNGYKLKPSLFSGFPTTVTVDMYLESVGTMSEINMDFPMTLYLRQNWDDGRLAFAPADKHILLREPDMDLLWIPDIYFVASKDERQHNVPSSNSYIRISSDGKVLQSQRLSLRITCQLLLQKFPLDEQVCQIKLGSYSHQLKDLILRWSLLRKPIALSPGLKMPNFEIKSITYKELNKTYEIGSYSLITAEMTLKRELGHYLIQTYMPSILVVILSWVSFWIDHQAIAARISLGLLTVLTVSTQNSSFQSRLPKVSYVKSIDVWMSSCLAFVFAALIEYAIVCELAKRERGASHRTTFLTNESGRRTTPPSQAKDRRIVSPRLPRNPAARVDLISRYLFPTSFLLFNIFYWNYYALVS